MCNLFSFQGLLALTVMSAVTAHKVAAQEVNYVIVGGGPAGFVLAEGLSRNPKINVTLLEAGPDGQDIEAINGIWTSPSLNLNE